MSRKQMIQDILASPLAEAHGKTNLLRTLNKHNDKFIKAVWLTVYEQEDESAIDSLASL